MRAAAACNPNTRERRRQLTHQTDDGLVQPITWAVRDPVITLPIPATDDRIAMHSSPGFLYRLSILATLPFGAICAAQTTPATSPDRYAPITMEVGTWDADVTFYDGEKPTGQGKGLQVNKLFANGHWITNEFTIPATDTFPAYEGHGIWGYDTVAKTYVNTWVDTNDLAVRTDYGFWQPKEQVMTWSTKQSDGNGHFVDYRMTEEFNGDVRVLTVYQVGMAKLVLHPLVKIVFHRRSEQ
jgi:hypothetical protein